MTTLSDLQSQVHELEGKAIDYVASLQAPAAEYVGKATETLAERLPADRPELLAQVIDIVVRQADFAKQAVHATAGIATAVLDAAVKPFVPAKAKKVAAKAA